MEWIHDKPSGVQHIEWWYVPGEDVGITKQKGGPYTILYTADGSPTNGNQYVTFKKLSDAKAYAQMRNEVTAITKTEGKQG